VLSVARVMDDERDANESDQLAMLCMCFELKMGVTGLSIDGNENLE